MTSLLTTTGYRVGKCFSTQIFRGNRARSGCVLFEREFSTRGRDDWTPYKPSIDITRPKSSAAVPSWMSDPAKRKESSPKRFESSSDSRGNSRYESRGESRRGSPRGDSRGEGSRGKGSRGEGSRGEGPRGEGSRGEGSRGDVSRRDSRDDSNGGSRGDYPRRGSPRGDSRGGSRRDGGFRGGGKGNNFRKGDRKPSWLADKEEDSEPVYGRYDGDHIYGINPVLLALRSQRRKIQELILQEEIDTKVKKDSSLQEILDLAEKASIPVRHFSKHDLNMMSDNRPHQGTILRAKPLSFLKAEPLPKSDDFK